MTLQLQLLNNHSFNYQNTDTRFLHSIIITNGFSVNIDFLNNNNTERSYNNKEQNEIGNFNKPLGYHISGDLEWSNAKFFKYETTYEQTKFVKKIKITTRSKVNNAKFKIRIFSVNKEGSPEDDLLYEDIIVTVKKGKRKNIIDISNFKLVFPKEGLFIAYEVLKIESNKYEFKYTENESKKLVKKTFYAPDFECNLVDEQNTYHFRNGKWIKHQRWHSNEVGSLKKFNNKVFEPAITLTLTN